MAGLSRRLVVAPPSPKALISASSRLYGSAALAHDYYYHSDEEEEEKYVPKQKVSSAGSVPSRGVQWVMIGEPGVRKHVYAERLAKLLEVPHISMGSLVKQELDPRSSLYNQIAKAVNEGKLVSEDVIFALLSKRLEEGYYRGETGFILDGIPKTRIQAEILDQIVDIDLAVNFKCTKETSVKRNIGVGLLSPSQKFLSINQSGQFPGLKSLNEPPEDSLSKARRAWEEKISIYEEQSKPLEEYYRKQKKLLDFQVADGAGETWQGLLAALHLQHRNAVLSSHKLTA